MAHTAQQQKRIRQDSARTAANTTQKSRMRTSVKNLEKTIETGNHADIGTQFKQAMSQLSKLARKGLVSKGAAKRKISRMAGRIAAKGGKAKGAKASA